MPSLEVTSEIYSECNYKTDKKPFICGNVVSEFPFDYPAQDVTSDEDGDLIVNRKQKGVIQIEHSTSTALGLVGLQVWRGAFLLGDLMLHWGQQGHLTGRTVLELGAGTGLTSLIAAGYADKVICTDLDKGGILDLIKVNVKRNNDLVKSKFVVENLDFMENFSEEIIKELSFVEIIFAADVIYDDDLTAHFVNILEKLLNTPPNKTILIALEKRYVFTLADLDSVAPCYETFLSLLDKAKCKNLKQEWKVEQIPLDFPQYFKYDRVKELVLWKLSTNNFL